MLLATGTIERPLPGVMTVGAAQIALKTEGPLRNDRSWLAGQEPLLLLYAMQVPDAGRSIAGIIDLSDGFAPLRALRHPLIAALPDIRRGLAWRWRLSQAGVRWIAASALRAGGDQAVQAVSFRTPQGWQTQDADLLLLHDGVIPSLQISRALGCVHTWSHTQRCWRRVVDQWARTSVRHVLIAGDSAGINGAATAVLAGCIAARGVAERDAGAADGGNGNEALRDGGCWKPVTVNDAGY